MTYCSACGAQIAEGGKFCAGCGSRLDLSSMPTELQDDSLSNSQPSIPQDGSPLVAGQILSGRYRIVGQLGKGGMGEVYRADDLSLEQTVAIKFLSPQFADNEAVRQRFQQEVRVARQISHPNLCRVHDIGEVDGRLYLTMEYIDGEDLASLIRRIGYLPRDKAVEIAQQLCGGLAAAHRQGMLHRDLKPANVMLDGKGAVKITDFGLAGAGSEIEDIRSGTPAYMSPEQLSGKEVTEKSDLYALGLVLYEVFTGRPAFRADSMAELQLQQASAPATPSSHVEEIDPAAERVILRCIDPDPSNRPESAIAVAAALPGGDPLAAALAAGETPSPDMVAAAGAEGTLSKPVAIAALTMIVLLFLLHYFGMSRFQAVNQTPLPLSAAVLEDRARQIASKFSPEDAPIIRDSINGFDYDGPRWRHIMSEYEGAERLEQFRQGSPSVIQFWYRQSPELLGSRASFPVEPGWHDPPRNRVGMSGVILDPSGRLVSFYQHPAQRDESRMAAGEVDWASLFEAAGLDYEEFGPTTSSWVPEMGYDSRHAWVGVHPDNPELEIRVEAAAFQFEPVYFEVVWPWTVAAREPGDPGGPGVASWITFTIILIVFSVAAYLAFRNVRAGRGDGAGAVRLAVAIVITFVAMWLLTDHHQTSIFAILSRFAEALSVGLFVGGLTWMLYLAIEPSIRRRFPNKIVSWTRLLSGRWSDPLVARDVLAGIAAGTLFTFGRYGTEVIVRLTDIEGASPVQSSLAPLGGASEVLGQFLSTHTQTAVGALSVALVWFALASFFQWSMRRSWLGTVALWVLLVLNIISQFSDKTAVAWGFSMITSAIFAYLIERHGVLGLSVAMVYGNTLVAQSMPSTVDVWWSLSGFLTYATVLLIAIVCFRNATGNSKTQSA